MNAVKTNANVLFGSGEASNSFIDKKNAIDAEFNPFIQIVGGNRADGEANSESNRNIECQLGCNYCIIFCAKSVSRNRGSLAQHEHLRFLFRTLN